MQDKIIFLVGPTASGKTDIAVALAQKINAEIISCDSMQIYRKMDIISSKPALALTRRVPHHLLDIIPPTREYNVFRYSQDALNEIRGILRKKKTPLFAGGTGLYILALIDGIFKAKAPNKSIRLRLDKSAKKFGPGYLYKRLKHADPEAAVKIHPHDTRRIIRALEVFESTGKPISVLQKTRSGLSGKFDLKLFCLDLPREKLYARINRRVDKMFEQGLEREVKKLLKLKLSKTARYCLGIREVKGYLDGEYSMEQAKELLKKNTRHYAKKQLTWFRKDKRINWIKVSDKDQPKEVAKKIWRKLY